MTTVNGELLRAAAVNNPLGRLSTPMRLFVALDIEEGIRNRIAHFMEEIRAAAADARWVNPESLHVTLKFIGERPDALVREFEARLARFRVGTFECQFA